MSRASASSDSDTIEANCSLGEIANRLSTSKILVPISPYGNTLLWNGNFTALVKKLASMHRVEIIFLIADLPWGYNYAADAVVAATPSRARAGSVSVASSSAVYATSFIKSSSAPIPIYPSNTAITTESAELFNLKSVNPIFYDQATNVGSRWLVDNRLAFSVLLDSDSSSKSSSGKKTETITEEANRVILELNDSFKSDHGCTYRITRWSDWMISSDKESFLEKRSEFFSLCTTNASLSNGIKQSATEFIARSVKRKTGGKTITKESELEMALRMPYAWHYVQMEMFGVLLVAGIRGFNYVLYPGPEPAFFTAFRRFFVSSEESSNTLSIFKCTAPDPSLILNWVAVEISKSPSLTQSPSSSSSEYILRYNLMTTYMTSYMATIAPIFASNVSTETKDKVADTLSKLSNLIYGDFPAKPGADASSVVSNRNNFLGASSSIGNKVLPKKSEREEPSSASPSFGPG